MSEPSPPPERPPIKKLTCLPPKLKTREEKTCTSNGRTANAPHGNNL